MAARWEQDTDTALIELWRAGQSIDGIAEKIGRTPSAVQSRACKLRLQRQPGDRSRYAPVTSDGKVYWTLTDDDRLRALMKARVDVAEAARQLGRTVSATETRWKRLGRPGSPRVHVAVAAKTRQCMCCRGVFNSSHNGNRLCLPCGQYPAGSRSQYD